MSYVSEACLSSCILSDHELRYRCCDILYVPHRKLAFQRSEIKLAASLHTSAIHVAIHSAAIVVGSGYPKMFVLTTWDCSGGMLKLLCRNAHRLVLSVEQNLPDQLL